MCTVQVKFKPTVPVFPSELATQMFQHNETVLLNLPSTIDSLKFPTNLVDPLPKIISISHLIFYYIPLYLTDMEQVSNAMQCIKHLSYHTTNAN